MFSTAQLDLIAPMVQSMYEQGYTHYVVHSRTNLENTYNNYDYVDLVFYFSKNEITFDNYTFTGEDVVKKEVISRNVSNSTSDSKKPRVTSSSMEELNVYVNPYEHIMTDADGAQLMDIMAMTEYQNEIDLSWNLSKLDYMVIPVLIAVVVLMMWFKMWFARNDGGRRV